MKKLPTHAATPQPTDKAIRRGCVSHVQSNSGHASRTSVVYPPTGSQGDEPTLMRMAHFTLRWTTLWRGVITVHTFISICNSLQWANIQSVGVLAWLSDWSEVQTSIWPGWCHCHSLSLASVKIQIGFSFLVPAHPGSPDKGLLDGCVCVCVAVTHTHTQPFNDPVSGTTRVTWYQKGKTNLDFTEAEETVSGSGISWDICKSAPRCRQITTPAPHRSVFYRPDALPAAQPTASKHWRHCVLLLTEINSTCIFSYSRRCSRS